MWATALVMVRALFHAGHPRVVLDATNTTRERRQMWYGDGKLWRTQFHVFNSDWEECSRRASEGGRPDLLPVIDRMAATWERLGEDEIPY